MNGFCDLLGIPDAPVSKIESFKKVPNQRTYTKVGGSGMLPAPV